MSKEVTTIEEVVELIRSGDKNALAELLKELYSSIETLKGKVDNIEG